MHAARVLRDHPKILNPKNPSNEQRTRCALVRSAQSAMRCTPPAYCATRQNPITLKRILRAAHQVRVGEVGPVSDAVHAARVLRDHRVPNIRKLAVLEHQEVCACAGASSVQTPGSGADAWAHDP